MLKAISIFALTNATSATNDNTVLLGITAAIAILALLFSLVALSRARKAGIAAKVAIDEALTAAAYPVGNAATGTAMAAMAPETDDRQLVAVISAAIAAFTADEQGTASAAAPTISSIRRVGPAAGSSGTAAGTTAATAGAAATAADMGGMPARTGPYAGFVVRRIRRI